MYAEISKHNILRLIEEWQRQTGKTMGGASNRFYSNGTFFNELKARQRSVSVDKLGEMLADIAMNWPKDVPWPDLESIHFTRENLVKRRFTKVPKKNPTRLK